MRPTISRLALLAVLPLAGCADLTETRLATPWSATVAPASLASEIAPEQALARLPAEASGKTDLHALVADLARRGINELHVEAGHKLNGSLLRAGLVDELLVYLAPRLFGGGLGMASFGPLASLDDSLDWQFTNIACIGPDLRLLARRVAPREGQGQ